MGTVASKGSGRCAVLFRNTVRIIKPSDRMNGRRLSNMCTEADSTEGLLMTLKTDRFAGEKAGPGLLAPAPFNRCLFSSPPGQGQGIQAKTFYSLCGRLCWTRIGHSLPPNYKDSYIHDLYRHTSYLK